MMESDDYERERTSILRRLEASRERVMDEVVRGLYSMAPKVVERTADIM
jgi:hypothetical protein